MPDPRCLHLGGEILIGYDNGRSEAYDEYGYRPWQKGYREKLNGDESRTLYAFQGEFARLFGPKRRGMNDNFGGRKPNETDSAEFHQYHLDQEKKNLPVGLKQRRDARSI